MTFKKSATIVLGFILVAATAGSAQASTPTYLPYTGHGGLEIVTDEADPETTGSIIEAGCSIYLPYTGHGGLEIVE